MYDAIVVGGRCGGSPTAMLLARRGYRVLLLDRSTFPSDTISTHWVWPPGLACLKRWGLLERFLATGLPTWKEYVLDLGDMQFVGAVPPINGVAEMCSPRRTILDKLLLDAAAQAGVEVRDAFSVTGLTSTTGRVTGIRGHDRGGAEVTESARIVIGADGRHSVVAQAVGAEEYNVRPVLTCWYYTYWSGIPRHVPGCHPRGRRMIFTGLTHDGNVITPICFPRDEFEAIRSDPERYLWEALELVPELAEYCRQGKRVERIYGSGDLPNFFRKPYGDGWALVGDAGYNKDPVLAQGLTDAFLSAEMLVEALHAAWSGNRPLAEALADYQHRRDEHFLPMYEMNAEQASMQPPTAETMALFRALQHQPLEKQQFLGTVAGTVPIREFYAPENIGRILAAAPTKAAAQTGG